jgi:hypothetical protein
MGMTPTPDSFTARTHRLSPQHFTCMHAQGFRMPRNDEHEHVSFRIWLFLMHYAIPSHHIGTSVIGALIIGLAYRPGLLSTKVVMLAF